MKLYDRFAIGCNYFASHAGTRMWEQWDERVVEKDFAALARHGMRIVRVFPIWSTFQPIRGHYRQGANLCEWRMGEEPLPDTPAGAAGVNPDALERLLRLLELARRHGLKVVVELVTGWMSGRNFRPDPLFERNFFTDSRCLQWQARLVECLVTACKPAKALIAWGLGNECNCIEPGITREAAWVWTALITRTVRTVDPSRPILSGMHGLGVADPSRAWQIRDQAELNDIVTIHPYPYYTPHCNRDRLTGLRTILHAAAESTLYADIGGKPCLAQEVGVLGPMIANDARSAEYLKSVLWSLWACNDLGCLWWMAFDAAHVPETPYDWNATERELGLMDERRRPKPVLRALETFGRTLEALPRELRILPPARRDAVCVLTHYQDNWTVAYAAYVLAKQAGFDIRFVHPDAPLPDSPVYMLPSIRGTNGYSRRQWLALLDRVRRGAQLYLSFSNAFVSGFRAITGLEVVEREQRRSDVKVVWAGKPTLSIPNAADGEAPARYQFRPAGAEVLATEEDGNPVLSRFAYGQGAVWFLAASLEAGLSPKPGAFEDPKQDYALLYRTIFAGAIRRRRVRKPAGFEALSLSEHPAGRGIVVAVGIHHGNSPLRGVLALSGPAARVERLHGDVRKVAGGLAFSLRPHDAFVVRLRAGRGR